MNMPRSVHTIEGLRQEIVQHGLPCIVCGSFGSCTPLDHEPTEEELRRLFNAAPPDDGIHTLYVKSAVT